MLLINIDSFKNINDSFGLEYGDEVLEFVKSKLDDFNVSDMQIFQLESDEFALLDNKNYDEEKLTSLD